MHKKDFQNQKGITLIALVVTIIILLILSTIGITKGIESYKDSKLLKFIAEMQTIQAKVDEIEDYSNLGENINNVNNRLMQRVDDAYRNAEVSNNYKEEDADFYRYFTVKDIDDILGIKNATSAIIVNFKTREVISEKGIDYNGTTYYTQYELPGGQKLINTSISNDRTIEELGLKISIEGLNATITIGNISINNGTITYKLENTESWLILNNYTKKGNTYDVQISVAGRYIFRLTDNTNTKTFQENSINVVLTNALLLAENMELQNPDTYNYENYSTDSTNWAYAIKDKSTYVWIPRFATKNDDIKFIRGNSRIATDNTYIDDTWTISADFTKEGKEITGLWLETSDITKPVNIQDTVQ